MLFSRDIYRVGARYPFVYGRQEVAGTSAATWSLYFTGLFANATDIANLPRVSPWHAIMTKPVANENIYNFVNAVPKGSKDSHISLVLSEVHNPFRRSSVSPSPLAIPFNAGVLPRTFCDPTVADAIYQANGGGKAVGDGHAIDVIELSGSPLPVGMVGQVKVLGAIATTVEGKKGSLVCDWKVLTANVDDEALQTLTDIPEARLEEIKKWLLAGGDQKGGKASLALGGKVVGQDVAMAVIEAGRANYDALRSGKRKASGIWLPDPKSNPAFQA
eukprot:GILI01006866.1.p1 GENE.GILI01006866.1~~GILI01006866.1.p1  ORF type:complete len:274 (-),score=74.32 GILI01006866.1:181-1002(-)